MPFLEPLAIENLTVTELNSTCVQLTWTMPSPSGFDYFKLIYGSVDIAPREVQRSTLCSSWLIPRCPCCRVHRRNCAIYSLVAAIRSQSKPKRDRRWAPLPVPFSLSVPPPHLIYTWWPTLILPPFCSLSTCPVNPSLTSAL